MGGERKGAGDGTDVFSIGLEDVSARKII